MFGVLVCLSKNSEGGGRKKNSGTQILQRESNSDKMAGGEKRDGSPPVVLDSEEQVEIEENGAVNQNAPTD